MIKNLILSDYWKVIGLDKIDSTNNYLHDHANKLSDSIFTVVNADFQISGKGQRGNYWESSPQKNLLFSVLCRPAFLPANMQFYLSQIISLSIKETLDTFTKDISIKWPNDIYWKEKKICGILIENDLLGTNISQCILGSGININQEIFTSDAPNPISLKQITKKEESIELILNKILNRFEAYYMNLQEGSTEHIRKQYAHALFRKNGFFPYQDKDGIFYAQIVRVEPSGVLVLKDKSDKIRNYAFKEVSFILK